MVCASGFKLTVLLVGGRKKMVFLSGFLAAFACSGSARITVFKSNLIQAGWLHGPSVLLLWMGLPVTLSGFGAAGEEGEGA